MRSPSVAVQSRRCRTWTSCSSGAKYTRSPARNGAGQSTLIKVLAGIHRPDTGKLTLNDQDLFTSMEVTHFKGFKSQMAASPMSLAGRRTWPPIEERMLELGALGSLGEGREPVRRFLAIDRYEPGSTKGWDDAWQRFQTAQLSGAERRLE